MTIENIFTLFMLILLQIVLGVDNLLYIALESQNVPVEKQSFVRKIGISLAIVFRIALLFILIKLIAFFQDPIFSFNFVDYFEGSFNIHSLIVFAGGGFIIFTAIKEIWHMISLEEHLALEKGKAQHSTGKAIMMIVIMNIVFSFDSILSSIALTKIFWIQAVAIIAGGILMIWLSEKVSSFLKKNRMYEVLGLFILFLVGIMLLTEAGHLSHIKIFGNEITHMNSTTFYFILIILVLVDIVQGKYQKKLSKEKQKNSKSA